MLRKWTDVELLQILEDQADGLSAGATAERYRVSRSAILGLRKRLVAEPSKHDGTLPERWWKAGLRVQGREA